MQIEQNTEHYGYAYSKLNQQVQEQTSDKFQRNIEKREERQDEAKAITEELRVKHVQAQREAQRSYEERKGRNIDVMV